MEVCMCVSQRMCLCVWARLRTSTVHTRTEQVRLSKSLAVARGCQHCQAASSHPLSRHTVAHTNRTKRGWGSWSLARLPAPGGLTTHHAGLMLASSASGTVPVTPPLPPPTTHPRLALQLGWMHPMAKGTQGGKLSIRGTLLVDEEGLVQVSSTYPTPTGVWRVVP